MLDCLCVMSSDAVNRRGFRVPLEGLHQALATHWRDGRPMLLNHDYHRPLGWMQPLGIHLQPGLARLFGLARHPEVEAERVAMKNMYNAYFEERIAREFEPYREELLSRLGGHLTANAAPIFGGCAAYVDTGLAERVAPHIFDLRNRHGLIPLSELRVIAPGIFDLDGLALFAHPWFRRAFGSLNSLNQELLEVLSSIDATVKIALDPDRVGLTKSVRPIVELAYAHGPPFPEQLDALREGICRHDAAPELRLFYGVSATEFWWYPEGSEWILKAEELADQKNILGGAYEFGCRYVHSEVLAGSTAAKHLDGAVRTYDLPMMNDRLEKNIKQFGRDAPRVKLWQVDGRIDGVLWKRLVALFFRGNDLVVEYLGAEGAGALRLETGESDDPGHLLAPRLRRGDGVHIAVSYRANVGSGSAGRSMRPLDSFGSGEERIAYVDEESLELVKLMKRHSRELNVSNVRRVIFEDGILNLPLIEHRGQAAVKEASDTLECIKELCGANSDDTAGKMVVANIATEIDDMVVTISLAGECGDLFRWLSRDAPALPPSTAEIGAWMCSESAALEEMFPAAQGGSPPLFSMLKPSGLILPERVWLSPDEVTPRITPNGERALDLALSDGPVRNLVLERQIAPSNALLIERSHCMSCGSDYALCDCLKMEGAIESVDESKLLGVFWTAADQSPFRST